RLDQHVAASLVEVDADDVARPDPCQSTAGGAFRRGIEDGGAVCRSRLPAVADRRQTGDALLEKMIRRLHVDDFGRARPAQRSRATDDEYGILVDAECGVVDAMMIIFRAIEDHRLAFEDAFTARFLEVALPEAVGDAVSLRDGEIEEVALQDGKAGLFLQRLVKGKDNLTIRRFPSGKVLGHRPAGYGATVAVELAGLQ